MDDILVFYTVEKATDLTDYLIEDIWVLEIPASPVHPVRPVHPG